MAFCITIFMVLSAQPVHAQVQRTLTNGGFESNNPGGGGFPGFQIFTSANVPGWDSTNNEIELWDSNYEGVPAFEGAVFLELLANSPSTLYQNICLVNGEILGWSFAHRARAGGPATQTVRLQVANSGGTVLQTLATQASTLTEAWNVNANSLGVAYSGATGTQRLQFSTPDTGVFGNFLDAVQLDIRPFVELSVATSSGAENIPTANLPTLIVNGNVPIAITVPVTITGGTATRGMDYNTPGDDATFDVTIPAGTYNNQAIALGITIINETEREFNETITMTIGTDSSYIISSTATCGTAGRNGATYTINNDDTRVAGTPPTLVCPAGTTVFDWDTRAWTAGATSANFAVTNIGNVGINLANPNGTWLNFAAYGGQSPARQNAMTGGLVPPQFSLALISDFTSNTVQATATISLATAVPGAQFRIFDVDFNAGQYSDRVTVTGTYNGNAVTPTLTGNVANIATGNSAVGDQTSVDTSSDGNVVVTFSSPVDTIIIAYGNHTTAPANPGQQAVTLHDFNFCTPQAVLSVTKISSMISDGVSATNPKAIPGGVVRYCILVSNAGSANAAAVTVTDAIPATVIYVPGTLRSGPSCASATTVEDDNAAGADESDLIGASVTGSTMTGITASLTPSSAFAIAFDGTLN